MKNSIKIAALALLALPMCFVSCEDAEYDTLGMHAFVSESAANKNIKVTIGAAGGEAELTACLSEAATEDVKLHFEVDTAVLNTYNKKQSSSFVALPSDQFEMDNEIVIKKGSYSAPATKIHFLPLKEEYIGESYALPLRLVCSDGSVPVTNVTSTFVITTESITVSSLPMWDGGAGLQVKGFDKELPQFTVEVRFQVSNTSNRNRSVFTNGGSVLLRFEDPQVSNGQFQAHSLVQFQGEGWYLNPTLSFAPNKWQHLALTYDGKKVTLYVNGAFAGSKEGVCNPHFGAAYWFGGPDGGAHGAGNGWWSGCKILVSEARIWDVCRTDAQILNNMTTTSSKAKGLVGYWRMNDGKGSEFEDCTGNGLTMSTDIAPTWVPGIKSSDVSTPWPASTGGGTGTDGPATGSL